MTGRYQVQQIAADQAKAEVTRIWQDNLGVQDVERKFSWTYRESPEPAPQIFLLSHGEGSGARSVGAAGVFVRRFHSRQGDLRAALLGDLAVDRPHRTLMPALTLVRETRRIVEPRYDLAYGFPNAKAINVFKRCGYTQLGTLTRYVFPLRHAGYLRRLTGNRTLGRLGAALPDIRQLSRLALRALATSRRYRLEWTGSADPSLDALWERARADYPLVGCRSASFVRWRLLSHPEEPCRIARLVQRGSGGQLRGYAAISDDGSTAHIRDLFGHTHELGALLDLLLLSLWFRGYQSASFRYLGSDQVVQALRSRGFWERESERSVIVLEGQRQPGGRSLPDTPGHWHLTDADEDI